MLFKDNKTIRVYPTFTYACGPKGAAFFILLHGAIIVMSLHFGLLYVQEMRSEIGILIYSNTRILMTVGLASLASFAFIELLLTFFFMTKLSKPIILTREFLIIPKWVIKHQVGGKFKQSLRVNVNEIVDITTRFTDTSTIPILRQAIPLPTRLTITMINSSVTLELMHVGCLSPINNWLRTMNVAVVRTEINLFSQLKYINFNGVTLACLSLSLMVAFVMPLLLWYFSP